MYCLLRALVSIALMHGMVSAQTSATRLHNAINKLSLSALEKRAGEIQSELTRLAHFAARGGIGTIGYRSQDFNIPDRHEWVQIELAQKTTIDEIILVPCLVRTPLGGYAADGFPMCFEIWDEDGNKLAEASSTVGDRPRTAPVAIPLHGQAASQIRVVATVMSPRAFDRKYVFKLSEILIFSGQTNLALRRPVTSSRKIKESSYVYDPGFLTDGSTPYLMSSAKGESSVAYLSSHNLDTMEPLNFIIDLGQATPLSGIHLHTVEQSDNVPQGAPGGVGVPSHLLIESANHADFSDARTLIDAKYPSVMDIAPILMWNIPETRCRYVRFTALTHRGQSTVERTPPQFGFAEVELLSNGTNVAAGKPVLGEDKLDRSSLRPLSNLTDARNVYGEILPTRQWLHELARRHELECELPVVQAALAKRYARQKANLRRITILTIVLGFSIVIVILIMRAARARQMHAIKERFAADLHDELGAKVHSIGLLSELANQEKDEPAELEDILEKIRTSTRDLGSAIRHCTNLLEADKLYTNLVADMHRTARRLMLDYEITTKGQEYLSSLDKQTQIDLLLFYKECLVNISRHARATRFSADLVASPEAITLTVTDNGRGLASGTPPSLKRRGRIIKGTVSSTDAPGGGTCISLSLPVKH
jgi:signal transduction histidine kinase